MALPCLPIVRGKTPLVDCFPPFCIFGWRLYLAAEQCFCAAAYGDAMKVELLQMATLMIRKAPSQLVQNRKEFIKFGWNNLKKDDSAVKYYAFQNVCHFFDAYAAPEKIVLQVKPIIVTTNCLSWSIVVSCFAWPAQCRDPSSGNPACVRQMLIVCMLVPVVR